MDRRLGIAAVIVTMFALSTPLPSFAQNGFVGCPAGQAIQGINFVTRRLVCVAVPDGAALQKQITALQNALANAQATIACMSTVGTDVFFDGCNVHIRSRAGATGAPVNGLGNLIIGYNEEAGAGFPAAVRTGSHNLVVGPHHTYSSFGGVVAGSQNAITGSSATVSGGFGNIASADFSSVSGGECNAAGPDRPTAFGPPGVPTCKSGTFSSAADGASVSGGFLNTANGLEASVSGGSGNTASGFAASVSGGAVSTASGGSSSVSGGNANTASGTFSSVSGGGARSAPGQFNWAAGTEFEPQ